MDACGRRRIGRRHLGGLTLPRVCRLGYVEDANQVVFGFERAPVELSAIVLDMVMAYAVRRMPLSGRSPAAG